MEIQFVDGASGKDLAERRGTPIGRKYAADSDSCAQPASLVKQADNTFHSPTIHG